MFLVTVMRQDENYSKFITDSFKKIIAMSSFVCFLLQSYHACHLLMKTLYRLEMNGRILGTDIMVKIARTQSIESDEDKLK